MRRRLSILLGILFWVIILSIHVTNAKEIVEMASANYGKNVKVTQTAKKITIEIDATQEFGESKSGKSITVATTSGNAKLEHGLTLGLNCYKKKEK